MRVLELLPPLLLPNKMNFQQVALSVMAFSSARGGSLERNSLSSRVTMSLPHPDSSRIIVEEDYQIPGLWSVSLVKGGRRVLHPPVYLSPVDSELDLTSALERIWDIHLQSQQKHHPAPFITRFLEPPRTPPNEPPSSIARTPPRSVSLHRQQRGVSPQTVRHLV